MLRQLGQAALSLDSPDRTAAQVLACLHGPEGEPQSTETETTEPKGEDDGDTSMEDGPLATMQDSDRYGVVKIVWTAEEDQQLLQVRPETACRRFNRIAHGMDTAYASECACALLTRARIAPSVAVGARTWPAPLVGDCRAAARSGWQAVPRTVRRRLKGRGRSAGFARERYSSDEGVCRGGREVPRRLTTR